MTSCCSTVLWLSRGETLKHNSSGERRKSFDPTDQCLWISSCQNLKSSQQKVSGWHEPLQSNDSIVFPLQSFPPTLITKSAVFTPLYLTSGVGSKLNSISKENKEHINKTNLASVTIRYPRDESRFRAATCTRVLRWKLGQTWKQNQNCSSATTAPQKITEKIQLFPFLAEQSCRSAQV